MSEQTASLLKAFDSLPTEDRQSVAIEILRRTRDLPFDSGPLEDREIGEAGRALFYYLDREENAAPR
jgi:hypothetical protein